MKSLQLVSLEMDAASKVIGEYFAYDLRQEIRRIPFPRSMTNKENIAEKLNNLLGGTPSKKLTLYGSGRYHHYTYGLCRHADRLSDEYCYIHFDHHDDYESVFFLGQDEINCEGFVKKILNDTNAKTAFFVGSKVLSFGPDRMNRLPYIVEHQLRSGNGHKEFEDKLRDLPKDVYISFDLDVMTPRVICTDFNQGTLKTRELLDLIEIIKENKSIIGADILGLSAGEWRNSGKELYAKIADKLTANKKHLNKKKGDK